MKLKKRVMLWLLVGAGLAEYFLSSYLYLSKLFLVYIMFSAFMLALICITPNKTLEETL